MRCKYWGSLVLLTAALAGLASALLAADSLPTVSAPSDATEGRELAAPAAKSIDVAQNSATATSAQPTTGVPTPAKRRAGAPAVPDSDDASKVQPMAAEPTAKDASAQPSKAKADEPLRPIPDPMEGGPVSIEAASFKGVTPGVSTKENVEKAWGKPKKTAQQNGSLAQLYSVEPFKRVEVNYSGNRVASLVVRFARAFPADGMAKQLDLATVRPVLVSNDLGEILGLAYPERGVLFNFEASKEPGKPSMKVAQLVLEPITAEPFILRAETTLESRCDLSRRDLEQALSLDPGNARAHWLYSRVLVTMEQPDKAVASAGQAVRLDPENPHYRVTRAQILAQTGRLSEAITEAQKAVDISAKRPHVKARALCLLGDLCASGPKPDYKKAFAFHSQSLQLADSLTSDPHPAIRVAAKEVLIDSHLGAAHDLAWGDWKEKNKAVAKWIERAVTVANDMVSSEGSNPETVFRVQVRAMAADVGLRGGIEPDPLVAAIVKSGDELIAAAGDPLHKAQLQWEVGMALYDATQIYQMRSDQQSALKYGQLAAEYLAKANEIKQSPSSAFLLGRVYFRLGTIQALNGHDHRSAIGWFEKALPLLERPSLGELGGDLGRHGEAFVSMGVSYWEVGQRQRAVALTEKGIRMMEQAVEQHTFDRALLAVPYNNLAAMHRALGSPVRAKQYQEMAARVKNMK
jgi:tetratricopeptide (TPR) repeat protein